MTIADVNEGQILVDEGSIFWRYVAVDDGEDGARPIVVFMHAGVTDHSLWDPQVEYLAEKGWSTLQFDMFGFGKSVPNGEYLNADPRPPFDMLEHVDRLRTEILPPDSTIIPVGLSMGAALALGYTVNRHDLVSGAVLVSGGVGGFEIDNTKPEDELFRLYENMSKDGDVHGAANLQVRIWGDGPLQEPGRFPEHMAEQMLVWNIDICGREIAKTGGSVLDVVHPETPAADMLHTIEVPVAVAYGIYDETYTIAAMKHVAEKVQGADVKEFAAAHMVNMEFPDEFNAWLAVWLETNFLEGTRLRDKLHFDTLASLQQNEGDV